MITLIAVVAGSVGGIIGCVLMQLLMAQRRGSK